MPILMQLDFVNNSGKLAIAKINLKSVLMLLKF